MKASLPLPIFTSRQLIVMILVVGLIVALGLARMHGAKPISLHNAPVSTLPSSYPNGSWLWQSPAKMDQNQINDYISFAASKNIKVIYLFIEDYLTIKEDPSVKDKDAALAAFNAKIGQFITTAASHGIQVEGLAGNTNWADENHNYIPQFLLESVFNFNASGANQAKFAGLQFDIEFYNDKNFADDKTQATLDYLTLASQLTTKVQSQSDPNFRLGFAIPAWLGDDNGIVPSVTFANTTQTALAHLLNILPPSQSYLALMAYRNHADGPNGVIAIAQNAVNLADAKDGRVKLLIGLETEKNKDKSITFYHSKPADFYNAITQIQTAFASSKSFSGLAIHALPGYQALDP